MQVITNFIIRHIYKIATIMLEYIIKQDKKNVAVIGLSGNTFEGNSKYFFEYLYSSKQFNPIWFSNRKDSHLEINRQYPNNSVYVYSFKAFTIFVKSRFAFCSYSTKNYNPLYISKKKICINLWHGTPMKRIGLLDPSLSKFQIKKLLKDISFTNYFIASSSYDKNVFKESFGIDSKSILIYGTPRNDYLLNKTDDSNIVDYNFLTKSKIILYAPTFRDGAKAELLPFNNINLDNLNNFLESHNAFLLVRKHHNEAMRFTDLYKSDYIRSRIIFAGQNKYPDVQPLLKYTDILITDYSGIYFDFLLLNRPIGFAPYDYNDYVKERNFLFDYYENTPGSKLSSQNDLEKFLEKALYDSNFESELRKSIIGRFHKYLDGKSCERISNKMRELI